MLQGLVAPDADTARTVKLYVVPGFRFFFLHAACLMPGADFGHPTSWTRRVCNSYETPAEVPVDFHSSVTVSVST